jgi:hypothetical protein
MPYFPARIACEIPHGASTVHPQGLRRVCRTRKLVERSHVSVQHKALPGIVFAQGETIITDARRRMQLVPGQRVWIDATDLDGRPMIGTVERVTEPTSVGRIVAIRLRSGRRTSVLESSRGTLWDVIGVVGPRSTI